MPTFLDLVLKHKIRLSTQPKPHLAKGMIIWAQDIAALDLWGNQLSVLWAYNTAMGDVKISEEVLGIILP